MRTEQEGLKYQVETAKQELGRRKTKVAELEEANARLESAKGYVTLTASYRSYETEIARLDGEVKRAQEKAAKAFLEADELRRASQNVVQRLSDHFGAIIRFLIPNGPQGNVVLAENGIHPLVSWHGNLTTAAVDSLKVVAFDLAALILAIEGKPSCQASGCTIAPAKRTWGCRYIIGFSNSRSSWNASRSPRCFNTS